MQLDVSIDELRYLKEIVEQDMLDFPGERSIVPRLYGHLMYVLKEAEIKGAYG